MTSTDLTSSSLGRWHKIIALLDSPHEGEATAALLMLRTQLAAQDMKLADLLLAPSPQSTIVAAQQREIEKLRGQLVAMNKVADDWRQTAQMNQRAHEKDSQAAAKWRRLAQATADSLWELGQQLRGLEEPATVVPFPRQQQAR